jgi:FkbM family methyltransferase
VNPNVLHLKRIAEDYGIDVRTIIEAGARDCADTLDLAEAFPAAQIFTFECNPQTLPLCRAATSLHSRIHLIETAVSEKDGKIAFFPIDPATTITPHPDGNPGASSIFRASGKYPAEKYHQTEIEVDCVTLESFCTGQGIDGIDLMWLDAQGAELSILKGLGKRIENVNVVQCEVEFREMYSGQPLWPEVHRFMAAHGFVFHGFRGRNDWFADAIYVGREFR